MREVRKIMRPDIFWRLYGACIIFVVIVVAVVL